MPVYDIMFLVYFKGAMYEEGILGFCYYEQIIVLGIEINESFVMVKYVL